MDPTTCQALCAVMAANSDQLGVILAEVALGLYGVVTTLLAFAATVKKRLADRRAEAAGQKAEAAGQQAEAAVQEAEAAKRERDSMAADRDYWREQSMRPFPRPAASPHELGKGLPAPDLLEALTPLTAAALTLSMPSGRPHAQEPDEAPEGGTRWSDPLSEGPADRPVQFDEPGTDPQKRKPP